jgi:cyclic-di-GMP-binding protein
MAALQSFDVTCGCDLQEVDNALNQARKEISQRFDFKGIKFEIDFRRAENLISFASPEEFHLKALWEVVLGKMTRRGVPTKNLKAGEVQRAPGGSVHMEVTLQQGIPTDTAREIVKVVKNEKMKKVQVAIQQDQVRVTSPSRDELQAVMAMLKAHDFGIELQFGNYRSQ